MRQHASPERACCYSASVVDFERVNAGWDLKASEPLQKDRLFLNTKTTEVPGTHLVDLRWMKGLVEKGAIQWF